MPLPFGRTWRYVQIATIGWCVVMTAGVLLGNIWTLYEADSPLEFLLKMTRIDKKFGSMVNVELEEIYRVLNGSVGITVVAIFMGIITSFAIICENRWLSILFVLLNIGLFVGGMAFASLAFKSRDSAIDLSLKMLQYGIARYTLLDDVTSESQMAAKWRFVVDQIQIEGECCGRWSHEDYKNVFPHVNLTLANGSAESRLACICGNNDDDCSLQHLPLSCCKKRLRHEINPYCVTQVFNRSRSLTHDCNYTKYGNKSNTDFHKNNCEGRKALSKLPHVWFLFRFGMMNTIIGFLAIVLATLNGLLAWKTVPVNYGFKSREFKNASGKISNPKLM